MITFKSHLEESLNSTYPITRRWKEGRSTFLTFSDEQAHVYEIEFRSLAQRPNTVEVGFVRDGRLSPQKDRSTTQALKVYSTIGRQIDVYLNDYREIDTIYFAAAHPDTERVYHRLAQKIAKQFGGVVEYDSAKRYWYINLSTE